MNLFIDPSYSAYNNNLLFDANNTFLNRDDTLKPFIDFKNQLTALNVEVNTFDLYEQIEDSNTASKSLYWSFGYLRDYEQLSKNKKLILDAFFILEPPLVAQHLYDQLPMLTRYFNRVYVHNINGDGFSLVDVDIKKLRKLYWPQPHSEPLDKFASNFKRQLAIAMICGLHKPKNGFSKELYSERIKALVHLSQNIKFDLYGRGWGKLFSRNALWLPYLLNYSKIMKHFKGSVESKFTTYSNYDFALCFENLEMKGYITEKIFDCFYAGVIPIYWGASDIENYIPKNCYIHFKDFKNYNDLSKHLLNLSNSDKDLFRTHAKIFLQSEAGKKYHGSLLEVYESKGNDL